MAARHHNSRTKEAKPGIDAVFKSVLGMEDKLTRILDLAAVASVLQEDSLSEEREKQRYACQHTVYALEAAIEDFAADWHGLIENTRRAAGLPT